jgi:Uma2 family endonuclease
MGVAAHISVEEYLHTVYRPDCDYVDGEVIERYMGERPHSECASEIWFYFRSRAREDVHPFAEWRVQVKPTRFRVPDVCLVTGPKPTENILTRPPFVAIEVLSPEDRVSALRQRVDDYLSFGVQYVWVIDPESETAWVYTQQDSFESRDLILKTENPELVLPLREIFEAIR